MIKVAVRCENIHGFQWEIMLHNGVMLVQVFISMNLVVKRVTGELLVTFKNENSLGEEYLSTDSQLHRLII